MTPIEALQKLKTYIVAADNYLRDEDDYHYGYDQGAEETLDGVHNEIDILIMDLTESEEHDAVPL